MRNDFTPDNIDLWMFNWKRKDQIDGFVRQWLNTFDFDVLNLVVNHSSVSINDFGSDIRHKIKIWNNVMRHDNAIGPITTLYNHVYMHTFLSGKKYCLCVHDNMDISTGWDDIIRHSDFELYLAPQGDQIHLMTLGGLRHFGWWDQRYAHNFDFETDFIMRVLRRDALLKTNKASLVDYHRYDGYPSSEVWEFDTPDSKLSIDNFISTQGHPEFPHFPYLKYNSVGLENVWKRANKQSTPQSGPKLDKFSNAENWHNKKWKSTVPPNYNSFVTGPDEDFEINWAPWLDVSTLNVESCGIR